MDVFLYFVFQSEWTKAFHIIFMVCWFACIFYLPRLFVNYAMADNTETKQQLLVMQRKLLRFSIPFPILTIITGAGLISVAPDYYISAGWFLVKLGLVAALIVYHFICGNVVRQFAAGKKPRDHVFYRIFNELPVLILFGVIILVEVRPF